MQSISHRITRHGLAFTAALALAAGPVFAADTWNGDTSTAWDTGANWDSGSAPDQPPTTPEALTFSSLTGGGANNYTVDLGGIANTRSALSLSFTNLAANPYTIQNGTVAFNISGNATIITLNNTNQSQATISSLSIGGTSGTATIQGGADNLLILSGTVSNSTQVDVRTVVQLDGSWNASAEVRSNRNGRLILNDTLTAAFLLSLAGRRPITPSSSSGLTAHTPAVALTRASATARTPVPGISA